MQTLNWISGFPERIVMTLGRLTRPDENPPAAGEIAPPNEPKAAWAWQGSEDDSPIFRVTQVPIRTIVRATSHVQKSGHPKTLLRQRSVLRLGREGEGEEADEEDGAHRHAGEAKWK